MSTERDKYRNPPPPVVYVQTGEPRLVLKKAAYEDDPIYILMSKLLEAKLYDIPNISQYDEFVSNPSSDDEIVEVPFVPVPKVVDTVDITAENDEPSKDPPVTIKKERLSPEPPRVSQDSVQTTATESEVRKHKKKHKKRRKHLESHSKRKSKHKKRSSSHSSEEDSPTDSYDSKKKNYEDSNRRQRRRSSSSRSRSRSRSRNRHRHRKNKDYSSYSEDDAYYKKEESYSSKRPRATDERQLDETDSHRQLHTPSPSLPTGAKVKEEITQNKNLESTSLFGDYHCKVCNVTANNELTFESHIKGKKHRKALENRQKEAHREATMAKIPLLTQAVEKLPKEEQIATKFLIPLQGQLSSKYPELSFGYRRKKLAVPSVIQSSLDNSSEFPCPGLHKVTEVRCPNETVYYCGMCDCSCSYSSIIQHLSGFKHQLRLLKYYRSDLFEIWNYKPKYQIQDKVINILYKEEKRNGRGLIEVEKDFKDTDDVNSETELPARNIRNEPSTSYQFQDADFFETYRYNSLPDPTKSGYYCKLCDSHSNSESMWNAHIIGKRHIANLKKNPGMAPSKTKYFRAESHVQPILFKIIEEENEYNLPIVGLDQIREVRKPDINGVLFTCFLCGASISTMEILNHIVSPKHREKYLISIKHPEMETLKDLKVAETFKSSILEEICGRVQEKEGMGFPDVFYSKR